MKLITITLDPSLIDIHIITVTILGYCIVLGTLSFLAFMMVRLHTVNNHFQSGKLKNKKHDQTAAPVKTIMTGEENAAIAAAIYLFFSELHDQEKYVMTIKKVSRTYSPWSSKFYNIWNNMKHW